MLVSKNEICKVADFGLSREIADDIYKVNKVSSIVHIHLIINLYCVCIFVCAHVYV